MSEISVELNAIILASRQCKGVQNGLRSEASKMLRQYEALGNGWNDDKYKELGQIVQKCAEALKQPISELQRCEVFLQRLQQAISEYEAVHFNGNGGGGGAAGAAAGSASSSTSSGSIQYGGTNRSREINIRRYNRMSRAASRNVDHQHETSLRRYCGACYGNINGHLRGTLERPLCGSDRTQVESDVANLTETLNGRRLGQNMVLYRGVRNPNFMLGNDWQNRSLEELNSAHAGRVVRDAGFVSTSVSQEAAEGFLSWAGATMIIEAPADANGMFVGAYNTIDPPEYEVLLQRNSDFRIDSISRDQHGMCVIRATLIGRGE